MHTSHRLWVSVLILILPALFTGGLLSFAGNSMDGLRLGCLSLLGCVLFYWATKKQNNILYGLTVLWWLIFWLDSILRSMSWFLFDSDTNAYFIVQSVANTSSKETLEFLQSHLLSLVMLFSALIIVAILYFYCLFKYVKAAQFQQMFKFKQFKAVIIFSIIILLVSYAGRPTRALFPVFYWHDYYQDIQAFQDSISTHQQLHHLWADQAQSNLGYLPDFQQQQTHVLVISESVTSFNLGVCGYPRQTTPELEKRLKQLKVFCKAYSPYSSTINSLKVNLTNSSIHHPDQPPSESLMSYAKAAGFKVYWLSNQDDSYISSLFGSVADTAIYNNKYSGRSSQALDEELLPLYQQALADPSPKKLIILHFIGTHPNYEKRYPKKFDTFSIDSNDKVEQTLKAHNIGLWVQSQRNAYDNAILYQDWLIDQLLNSLQQKQDAGQRSFTYYSDHGNEVGHELDFAGHHPHTEAGYRVPVIIWYDQMQDIGVDDTRILDTSALDQNVMRLMGLEDKTEPPKYFWFDKNYQFQPDLAYPYWQKK